MKLSALFLFAAALQAQTLMINTGGPATGAYLADQGFTGGSVYGPAQQPDMATRVGVYQTLRYGAAFSYDLAAPITSGTCLIKFDLFENRPAVATSALPASGPGLRTFSINTNGVIIGVDVFALAGAQNPYVLPGGSIPVTNGRIHIDFKAIKGNASVSGIEIGNCAAPAPPPATLTTLTLTAISGPTSTVDWSKVQVPGMTNGPGRTVAFDSVPVDASVRTSWAETISHLSSSCYRIANVSSQASPILLTADTPAQCDFWSYYPLWFKASEFKP